MKQKKILAALLAAFFIMLFPVNADASMTVGILKDNAPYSTFYRKKARGLEPEIARKLTNDSVSFKAYDTRRKLEAALKKRQIQIAFGSIDALNVNQDVFDVSEPYLYEPNILFRRHDGKRKTLEKLANKPVGMLTDGNQTQLLKNLLLKPRYFKNIKAMDKALAEGKIHAAILSDYEYSNYLKDHPEHVKAADATNDEQTADLFVKISDPAITSSQFVAVTYKNEELLKKINSAISSMHDDGTLQELSQKYLGKDISLQ
ncbi:substrate-binding periplasmic protein [Ligilactobacillus sp.]|uniref:substrate-binding periplasmic protein n=1 Tax=Ligilactobacillus sp. TaxID=2767921 RepID=UPI002FDF613C